MSIVEAISRKAQKMGLKKPGLMGTKLNMESDFYKKPFIERGMSVVVPTESEQEFIQQKLFSKIELGIFNDSTGWYFVVRIASVSGYTKLAPLTSSFTFILMIFIWGRAVPLLFNPNTDFQNFGHPFIFYDPKISLIGWFVLMIFISPFLQLLTTIFAAFITLIKIDEKNNN